MAAVKVGLIGCGSISRAYVHGCEHFELLELVACADILPEAATALATKYELRAMSVAELLQDEEIDVVVNLTIPAAHAEVSLAIIDAGKHVYTEKPLAISREDGQAVLAAAEAAGVRIGSAPDTFLGGGLQTCRKLIDDGWIGEPVAASAFMMRAGPESWHPNPHFFYQPGAGPMFDMGPYYLTALIHLLGPVESIAGISRISFAERIATSEVRYGEPIEVTTPTHVTGLLNFANGPVGSIITTFDAQGSELPHMEIYGSEGTLSVPDPNRFDGPVRLKRAGEPAWMEIPLTHSDKVMRGIGLADMMAAVQAERPHRASGEMAYHVLDLMQSFLDSSQRGEHLQLESSCKRPSALPMGLLPKQIDF